MPTSVRLEKEFEVRLDRLAARTGRTKAYYLREIIANGISDMEQLYLREESEHALPQDLIDLAHSAFDDREAGLSFLRRPHRLLGNRSPASVYTKSPEKVKAILNAIVHGLPV